MSGGTYGSDFTLQAAGRVNANLTPTFTCGAGVKSVTRIEAGVFDIELNRAIGTNEIPIVTVCDDALADADVCIAKAKRMSNTVYRVTTWAIFAPLYEIGGLGDYDFSFALHQVKRTPT